MTGGELAERRSFAERQQAVGQLEVLKELLALKFGPISDSVIAQLDVAASQDLEDVEWRFLQAATLEECLVAGLLQRQAPPAAKAVVPVGAAIYARLEKDVAQQREWQGRPRSWAKVYAHGWIHGFAESRCRTLARLLERKFGSLSEEAKRQLWTRDPEELDVYERRLLDASRLNEVLREVTREDLPERGFRFRIDPKKESLRELLRRRAKDRTKPRLFARSWELGKQVGLMEALIERLEATFGALPDWALERISISDEEDLDGLFELLVLADTREDLLHDLRKSDPRDPDDPSPEDDPFLLETGCTKLEMAKRYVIAEGRIRTLLRLLALRFGPLPELVKERMKDPDPGVLERCRRGLVSGASLEDMFSDD